MSLYHGRACAEDACDWCQKLAEDRAYDWTTEPDHAGERMYEAYLDRLGQ